MWGSVELSGYPLKLYSMDRYRLFALQQSRMAEVEKFLPERRW